MADEITYIVECGSHEDPETCWGSMELSEAREKGWEINEEEQYPQGTVVDEHGIVHDLIIVAGSCPACLELIEAREEVDEASDYEPYEERI